MAQRRSNKHSAADKAAMALAAVLVLTLGGALSYLKPVSALPAPVEMAGVASQPAAAQPVPTPAAAADASPQATAPSKHRNKEQAAAALMALPELRAWSAQLERESGGKVHGAVIEYDSAQRSIKGKRYYQFSFVENSAEAALRRDSFLVSDSDDEILVEDIVNDEPISLARWRQSH
ncbi:hypothetical protein ACFOLJ_15425 [Rugamonas sp. CCM 8940]|uniref:hypothetical protein n=1 Tax=Rugamonas sp. CCM 8940 TaxID=2765359 RepID=UPI001F33DF83|nr:hypothetical protein [Rugamonas sp. CCM 8940]